MTPPENPSENPAPETREVTFSLKRAAEVAGVSPSTLRRNKDLLRQHGATITESGWKVPMSALIASGLMRRQTPPDPPASVPRAVVETLADDDVRERVRELEREALELRHRAELAEQRARAAEVLAEERARTLEIERRMITAGTSPAEVKPAPAGTPPLQDARATEETGAAEGAAPAPARHQESSRSWWQKIFR